MALAKNYRVPPATAKAIQLPTFDSRESLRSFRYLQVHTTLKPTFDSRESLRSFRYLQVHTTLKPAFDNREPLRSHKVMEFVCHLTQI